METKDPIEVVYCPICTFPLEYCEYSDNFAQCKKWLAINSPESYPELSEEFEKIRNGESVPEEEKKEQPRSKKVKFEKKKEIQISLLKRGNTKKITKVEGLPDFGINLKDVSKSFRKEFSSGCAVVDDCIEIQGDLVDSIIEKILADFPQIKEEDIAINDINESKKTKKGIKK